MSEASTIRVSSFLGRLLATEGGIVPRERYQEPKLKQTSRGVWFIRPWVDVIDKHGSPTRAKKTISIGSVGKREAQAKSREIMATLNRTEYIIASQVKFGTFLDQYEKLHVERKASSTRAKYTTHLRNHIRPAFGKLMLCDLTPLLVQKWLDAKGDRQGDKPGLSWATRTDLRNILSSIYTKAIEWGCWRDGNPIEHVHAGRKRAAREKRKLTDDQTRRLLAALPYDLRIGCCACLFCTLRVSELLGLQEKHLDFERGLILVRQRFSRGDLDVVKNEAAYRDLPMGYLSSDLKALCKGDPERFVFQVATRPEWGKKTSVCRDDRDLNQHFLRPAAKSLGFYWLGFGFHALRREAITAIGSALGVNQAMRMAGHSSADMSLGYTLADQQVQDSAVRARHEAVLGKPDGKAN